MKTQTTKKYINNIASNIIKVSYCDLQHLLSYEHPVYYTAGVYGWNADIYYLWDAVIVTGYRPFGNIIPPYSMIENYDNLAREVLKDSTISEIERREKVKALLDEFIKIALSGKKL